MVISNLRVWGLLVFLTSFLIQRSATAQYTSVSNLSDGSVYKISTNKDAVYIITYDFLRNELGVDVDNINPANIQLFGNGGGLLPENIDNPRIDDLQENAIQIEDGGDGKLDPGDYILFYGQAADQKSWNAATQRFTQPKNIYSDDVNYFLKIGNTHGLRLNSKPTGGNSTYISTAYDYFERLELEKINLLDDFSSTSGTGQTWFGDLFQGLRERQYEFDIPQLITNEEGYFKMAFAARGSSTSTLIASIENQEYSRLIGSVNLADSEGRYARIGELENTFLPQDEKVNVQVSYPQNSGNNVGWLDYIELNIRRRLSMADGPILFSDKKTLDHSISRFQIEQTLPTTKVWDVTDPLVPIAQSTEISGSTAAFSFTSDTLRTFNVFNINEAPLPVFIEQINNQNLHSIDDVDMVVIYHPDLIDAAELYTSHRSNVSNLSIATVDINQVFNEFGSGSKDPTAIRDLAKMLHDRSSRFKYLLLIGDASFDFKNLKGLPEDSNLIPTYETKESLDPIRGFPSDDFFGLLSEGEGTSLRGALDIAIGRLPAKNSQEAMNMVNKIIAYETDPDRFGDWINKITFIADDEDFNIHLNQADQIAETLINRHPLFNVDKIYLDAFKQESTAGGELYPSVQKAINNSLFKGTNVINYMGHGGSTGFAQERILTINDVSNWSNAKKLALFVTATCTFAGYDDPNFVSAGERAILNPNGGAIALFTTVRAVYSSSNERLTKAVFDNLFEPVDGRVPPIGEILRIAKNSNAADTLGINARKFLLIGDPSMHLATPKYGVTTTEINGLTVSSSFSDTLNALEPIVVKGYIGSNGNIQTDFSGKINIEIYDKSRTVNTLGQDNTSFVKSFETRKNVIFKGIATVTAGAFEYGFVVPKDIDYPFGQGKISYYARSNNNLDASGFYDNIIVGGTSDSSLPNDQAPQVNVFLDSENFKSGGITGPNPTLLIHLSDDYGINIVGNSIGHDITAVIDNDTRNTIILNEFYESELDNTTTGTVRFPLSDLKEGKHTIEVKAWDIANNSATGQTEFIVASANETAIKQVLNYPNPVVDQTSFRIDHNISGGLLDITIDIYAIDGRLVKSLYFSSGANGGLIDNLNWDGKDNSGLMLETGVYVFKVNIKDSTDSDKKPIDSKLEKLVIIR